MKMKKSTMMRRKAMKKSVIAKGYKTRAGANRAVFEGRKMKTVGGLKKDSLVKNKNGKIVSKKASLKGKKNKWMAACAKARANLKLKGFSPIGGKSKLYTFGVLILNILYFSFVYRTLAPIHI